MDWHWGLFALAIFGFSTWYWVTQFDVDQVRRRDAIMFIFGAIVLLAIALAVLLGKPWVLGDLPRALGTGAGRSLLGTGCAVAGSLLLWFGVQVWIESTRQR